MRRLTTAIVAFLAICAVVLLIGDRAGNGATTPSGPVATSSDGLVAWRDVPNPDVIDDALGLYLLWQRSPLGQTSPIDVIDRVDRATGRIEASRDLVARFASSALADKWLFVSTISSSGEDLLRLNPITLAVTMTWKVTASQAPNATGALAVVNGGVWVATGSGLVRLSLTSNTMGVAITLPGREISDVASDAKGDVLVVGTANSDSVGTIERRNPQTGALLASSAPLYGVTVPTVSAVADGAVWVSEPTGMMGYTEELDVVNLKPAGPSCAAGRVNSLCVSGTNGIGARVSGSVLWVSQLDGGPLRNYCADPKTGRILATIPLTADEEILTTGSSKVYLLDFASTGQDGGIVTEIRMPLKCATG